MTTSTFLRNARIDAGLTQRNVSTKMGWSSPQYVSNWERNISPAPFKDLKKLSKALGLNAIDKRQLIEVMTREYQMEIIEILM